MSADKYPSIFLRQMEAIVYIFSRQIEAIVSIDSSTKFKATISDLTTFICCSLIPF